MIGVYDATEPKRWRRCAFRTNLLFESRPQQACCDVTLAALPMKSGDKSPHSKSCRSYHLL